MGFIFADALLGFALARLQYLDFYGRFRPSHPAKNSSTGTPDTCYWVLKSSRFKVGMLIHLSTVLRAALLAVFSSRRLFNISSAFIITSPATLSSS